MKLIHYYLLKLATYQLLICYFSFIWICFYNVY